MKRKYIIIAIVSTVAVLVLALLIIGLFYFSVLSGAIFSLSPNPPKPEITYGEFPISITCEIEGEVKIIEDTVICEFDGFSNLGSGGKHRKWKAQLKSGNEHLTLLKIDETSELYCSYGLAEYYMDDLRFQTKEEYEQAREHNFNKYFIIYERLENGECVENRAISTNEAWNKYKFKVLDRKYAQPITNSFS